VKPSSPSSRCRRSKPAYCGVYPQRLATFTASTTLAAQTVQQVRRAVDALHLRSEEIRHRRSYSARSKFTVTYASRAFVGQRQRRAARHQSWSTKHTATKRAAVQTLSREGRGTRRSPVYKIHEIREPRSTRRARPIRGRDGRCDLSAELHSAIAVCIYDAVDESGAMLHLRFITRGRSRGRD